MQKAIFAIFTILRSKSNPLILSMKTFIDAQKELFPDTLATCTVATKTKKCHYSHATGEFEWYSPAQIIKSATICMGSIDLDPASCTLANKTVKADSYYTKEVDGLTKAWVGNVWMNPPYAATLIKGFAEAAASKYEKNEYNQICILVNNCTETRWFHRLLSVATAICLIKGRLQFTNKHGLPGGTPLQGQCVVYIGKQADLFCEAFKAHGKCLYV